MDAREWTSPIAPAVARTTTETTGILVRAPAGAFDNLNEHHCCFRRRRSIETAIYDYAGIGSEKNDRPLKGVERACALGRANRIVAYRNWPRSSIGEVADDARASAFWCRDPEKPLKGCPTVEHDETSIERHQLPGPATAKHGSRRARRLTERSSNWFAKPPTKGRASPYATPSAPASETGSYRRRLGGRSSQQ